MDISQIGEFGLIDRLTNDIKPKNESTRYGVGDDCAVLHYPHSEVLVTTDMLMEGVHFDLTYIDLKHLGYKSAMVNISDIFAMNGTPRQMTVSLALSKRFSVEDVETFYEGLRLACEKWGVDIVGGDTTSSFTGLAISITCIGEARREDIVYRNGARNTDLVCVSGDLGAEALDEGNNLIRGLCLGVNHYSIGTGFNIRAAAVDRIIFTSTSDERFAAGDDHEVVRNLCLLADLDLMALVFDEGLLLDIPRLEERILLQAHLVLDDDCRNTETFKRADKEYEMLGQSA